MLLRLLGLPGAFTIWSGEDRLSPISPTSCSTTAGSTGDPAPGLPDRARRSLSTIRDPSDSLTLRDGLSGFGSSFEPASTSDIPASLNITITPALDQAHVPHKACAGLTALAPRHARSNHRPPAARDRVTEASRAGRQRKISRVGAVSGDCSVVAADRQPALRDRRGVGARLPRSNSASLCRGQPAWHLGGAVA